MLTVTQGSMIQIYSKIIILLFRVKSLFIFVNMFLLTKSQYEHKKMNAIKSC